MMPSASLAISFEGRGSFPRALPCRHASRCHLFQAKMRENSLYTACAVDGSRNKTQTQLTNCYQQNSYLEEAPWMT
jgi:hypothetical protein